MARYHPPTTVVFRTWPNGLVQALFPEIDSMRYARCCLSYTARGGEGAANYGKVVERSRPSRLEEIAPLRQELENHGYNLRVRRKYRPARK